MSNTAAIQATFSDFRIIRGRKVCQVVLELPVERADEALRVLGGIPQPHTERWVALARLDPDIQADTPGLNHQPDEALKPDTKPDAPKPRRRFDELPLSQQAALLSQDEAFQTFVTEEYSVNVLGFDGLTAHWLREHCGVQSRADILPDTPAGEAFLKLRDDFWLWRDSPDFYIATRMDG